MIFGVRVGPEWCFTRGDMMRLFPILLLVGGQVHGATVEVRYSIVPDSSTGVPITIPNPDGGELTLTPSAGITSGVMTVRFTADGDGVIQNGSAVVMDLAFTGTSNLRVTTGQQIFGQDVFVDITGPLTGDQQTWSFGSLAGLSNYSESTGGSFETVFGPTGCSGNFFNIGCAALALATGIEFPLASVTSDDVTLSLLNGTFSDLDAPGYSTASNSFNVPIQGAGGIGAPLPVTLNWAERDRSVVVPEPGAATLSFLGVLGLIFRKRRGMGGQ